MSDLARFGLHLDSCPVGIKNAKKNRIKRSFSVFSVLNAAD